MRQLCCHQQSCCCRVHRWKVQSNWPFRYILSHVKVSLKNNGSSSTPRSLFRALSWALYRWNARWKRLNFRKNRKMLSETLTGRNSLNQNSRRLKKCARAHGFSTTSLWSTFSCMRTTNCFRAFIHKSRGSKNWEKCTKISLTCLLSKTMKVVPKQSRTSARTSTFSVSQRTTRSRTSASQKARSRRAFRFVVKRNWR